MEWSGYAPRIAKRESRWREIWQRLGVWASVWKQEMRVFVEEAETNEEAAERVMDQYGDNVLRLAYSYLHNLSDAEDVLQEVVIRYFEKAPRFENGAHEKAWLLQVTANMSKNRLKYNARRDADELNEQLVAEKREDLSFVWEAVKALPVQSQEVLYLFYHEGYRTAQIGKILGRKESSVRSDLHRGRERLKRVLKEEYAYEEGV